MMWRAAVAIVGLCLFLQVRAQERASDVASFLHWYGHASFRLQDGERQIYIDPWKVPGTAPLADIVLVTHSHFDHFAPSTIAQLAKGNTRLVAPRDVTAQAEKSKELAGLHAKPGNLIAVAPGDTVQVNGVEIVAVPAYNMGKEFHPKANRWVGYLVRMSSGLVVYHAGDTDFVPEMARLRPDVALLPIGGTYTMGPEEAAKAAQAMGARVVVPMHYGEIVGSAKDADRLRELLGKSVLVLSREK
ncbi:MAG: MBL fold metallo-hydrolase [bacterium]|jgi:L-ascorbate metabolism protein UlaG (beta-lactamase superfamily)|nr:MBL fold metallo-hydrolase [candidate division KSB1 bacterium]MDH7559510.1 MBL fold metallo-hydrolase [bacterium]